MSEIPHANPDTTPPPEQLSALESHFQDPELCTTAEEAQKLRADQEGWLERRGLLIDIPRIAMRTRELWLIANAPLGDLDYVKELYGIPHGDQEGHEYALVDETTDDPDLPPQPRLITLVSGEDFGITIDPTVIAQDFQNPEPNTDAPITPERSGGALKTVDIGETITESLGDVESLVERLMLKETVDPFSRDQGDIGVRAGGIRPGQEDAYVWKSTHSPLTESLRLTLLDPNVYDSICIVRGQQREPANGKVGMAQIENPTEVFKITGERLQELQGIYRRLYREPDFALSEAQKTRRDEVLNNYLTSWISEAARNNKAQHDAQGGLYTSQQPTLQAREIRR